MTDRANLEPEVAPPEEPELTEAPTPSIQQVFDAMEQRQSAPARPAEHARALLGEVTDTDSPDHPGRVLVRWIDEHDTPHERWLVTIRGLSLQPGERVLLNKPGNWSGWVITGAIQQGAPTEQVQELDVEGLKEALDIKVEGRRLEIEGKDEVVIRCGKASITLRRNGRIIIKGTYVESRSKGTNRIKGGSVQIN